MPQLGLAHVPLRLVREADRVELLARGARHSLEPFAAGEPEPLRFDGNDGVSAETQNALSAQQLEVAFPPPRRAAERIVRKTIISR